MRFPAAAVLAVLCGLIAVTTTAHATQSGRTPLPEIAIAQPGQCVEPKEVMRREHMTLLRHQRDRTLREGIRTKKYSLNECIACHASRETGSVIGAGGFCQGCHDYAAVKPDCWDCHQPKPGRKTAVKAQP
ncbi:MAG: hypothetical protein LBE33_08495 [Zoogloeaceae bacterium]|jgi:hypothetical protein|nr:hypothetical protein [Zoogloeaceae bacterium]